MNLESQVCSLGLAKRLKELGVDQESYFFWIDLSIKPILFHAENDDCNQHSGPGNVTWLKLKKKEGNAYSAFTVAELLELLPHRINIKENEPYNSFRFRLEKGIWVKNIDNVEQLHFDTIYIANYYCDTTSQEMSWMYKALSKNFTDENCSNALAKMLVYLIENKLMEIPT